MNNEINIQQKEEEKDNNNNFNTINQDLKEKIQNESKEKIGPSNMSPIPLKETHNLNIASNPNDYNDLNEKNKGRINAQKNDQKRSISINSKNSFDEKLETMKLQVPINLKLNHDPTAEIIIKKLEQNIDVLSYENSLLTKNLKNFGSNNNELNIDLTKKAFLMKSGQPFNDENYKIKEYVNDFNLSKEIMKLRIENDRLKKENQILSQNNIGLNNIIEELKKNKYLIQTQFNEEVKKYKNLLKNGNYNDKEFNFKNVGINKNYNINNQIKESYNHKQLVENKFNNLNFDINKYLLIEQEYKKLLKENENLQIKLKSLLSINNESNNKNATLIPKNNNNNINIEMKEIISYNSLDNKSKDLNIINNNNSADELYKENILLKQKLQKINEEIIKINEEQSIMLSKIHENLLGYDFKKNIYINNINENKNNEEDLDILLNEALLMNVNDEDEKSKEMLSTIENIKDNSIKRIHQCLFINNKLKSLIQENNFLYQKLSELNKENNNISNNFENQNVDLDFYGNKNNNKMSYEHLIDLLRQKDEIQDSDEENQEIMIENRFRENNRNMKRKNINNRRKKINLGNEDNMVGKIVYHSKKEFGENEPLFKDSSEYEEDNKENEYKKNLYFKY